MFNILVNWGFWLREKREKREQTWFTDGSYTQLFTDCSMQEKLPSFKETFWSTILVKVYIKVC